MHVRHQIRNAAVGALTGTPGLTVYDRGMGVLHENELPACDVLTGDEVLERRLNACAVELSLTVQVNLYVQSCRNVEDQIDDFCVPVHQRLAADPTLGGVCRDLIYAESAISRSREGEIPFVLRTLEYTARYAIDLTDPETSLP